MTPMFKLLKIKFYISLEERVTPNPTPSLPKEKKKVRNIKLDFISVFVFTITAPQAVQGQISLVKKKLVRVLHLSLVGVFKINIIPPMGEKVKFIPRQAAV